MLRDKNEKNLENGLYVGPDPINPTESNIYEICISKDNSFSAEYWDGFLSITEFEEAARHFTKLGVPPMNSRFLDSKLNNR